MTVFFTRGEIFSTPSLFCWILCLVGLHGVYCQENMSKLARVWRIAVAVFLLVLLVAAAIGFVFIYNRTPRSAGMCFFSDWSVAY